MRIARIILALVAASVVVVLFLWSVRSPYIRFMDKSPQYYSDLAHACDSVLAQHPLRTNDLFKVLGSDSSVPSIIRHLHPSGITVSSNRVYIMVGVRDFGISWQLQDGRTNTWAMDTFAEGLEKVVYVETR